MVRFDVPFFGLDDGPTFADVLEQAIVRGPANIAEIYKIIEEEELKKAPPVKPVDFNLSQDDR